MVKCIFLQRFAFYLSLNAVCGMLSAENLSACIEEMKLLMHHSMWSAKRQRPIHQSLPKNPHNDSMSVKGTFFWSETSFPTCPLKIKLNLKATKKMRNGSDSAEHTVLCGAVDTKLWNQRITADKYSFRWTFKRKYLVSFKFTEKQALPIKLPANIKIC